MRALISLIVLCIAGGIGWLCVYFWSPARATKSPVPEPAPVVQASSSIVLADSSSNAASDGSVLAQLTAMARSRSTEPFAIDTYLFERIEKMAPIELGALVLQMEDAVDVRVSERAKSVVDYWIDRDFPSARDWLKNLPRARMTIGCYAIAKHWAQADPRQLVTWMESLPAEGKLPLLAGIASASVNSLASEYADRLVPIFLQIPENLDGDKSLSALFAGWAQTSPAIAGARALGISSEPLKARAVEGVAMAWSKKDPKASLAWVASIQDAVLATKAQSAIIRGLSTKDPAAAMDHLTNLPLTVESSNLVGVVVKAWVDKDAMAALRWADALNDEDSRQLVFENLIYWNAIRNADGALETLVARADQIAPSSKFYEPLVNAALKRGGPEQLDSFFARLPENHRKAVADCVTTTLRNKPEVLERWAALQPEGASRSAAYATIAFRKFAKSGEESKRWAESLPVGESRDAVASRLAEAFAARQPDEAVKLSRLISDPQQTEQVVLRYFPDWQKRDRGKAIEWLQASKSISDPLKQTLLNTP